MRRSTFLIVLALLCLSVIPSTAQNTPSGNASVPLPPHEKRVHLKHLLVISQTKGFEHDSVPDGMVA
ncbi:MAG TPA: hypothetical protein VMU05_07225, partial [Dongiaceae bacterium]|nr:hypothetical protein [Dongiaceae bacterium]